ncbi:hypothetical protein [Aeoliella straminimaris]|nr:hypothetical protein [Aeoliella straminimaris]
MASYRDRMALDGWCVVDKKELISLTSKTSGVYLFTHTGGQLGHL